MKIAKYHSRLSKLIESLESKIEARANIFSLNKRKWQEGLRGVDYQERTDSITEAVTLIKQAEVILNDLR